MSLVRKFLQHSAAGSAVAGVSAALALLLLLGLSGGVYGQIEVPEDWRDPFWPVGYAPAVEELEPEVEEVVEDVIPVIEEPPVIKPIKKEPPKPTIDWSKARRHLKITGFAESQDRRACFINGKLIAEGENAVLDLDGFRYTWKVVKVDRDPAGREFQELTVMRLRGTKE